jgi:hypothetical protein
MGRYHHSRGELMKGLILITSMVIALMAFQIVATGCAPHDYFIVGREIYRTTDKMINGFEPVNEPVEDVELIPYVPAE